jgi:hypothetical protein
VATTSSIDQKIIGYLAINAHSPAFSQQIDVHGSAIAPTNNTTGGQRYPRPDAPTSPPTRAARPDHHQHHRSPHPGDVLGHQQRRDRLLTAAVATTAVSSLPLQHANGTAEHLWYSAPLTLSTRQRLSATLSVPTVDRVT